MPIRFIDPQAEFTVTVNGTECTFRQVYPQGDMFKMERCRRKLVESGAQIDLDALISIMLKHLVEVKNLPEGWDLKKGLQFMALEDLIILSVSMTNKSTFSEAEEKN